jgi:hypothetical protein
MRPLPPKPRLLITEGKGRPSPHAKLPEGQQPEKLEDVEEPKVKPITGHELPAMSLLMEQKVSLICICEQPMPIMAFQELNALGHGAEKIKPRTYQTPASSSNIIPVPLPKLLEPQVREQQKSVWTPSAYFKQPHTPYKHSENVEEKTSQTLRNDSVSLRCIFRSAMRLITCQEQGHTIEKTEARTSQASISSSNTVPVPPPAYSEPQARQQQLVSKPPALKPPTHSQILQRPVPYKHDETLEEKTTPPLRSDPPLNLVSSTTVSGPITPSLPIVSRLH